METLEIVLPEYLARLVETYCEANFVTVSELIEALLRDVLFEDEEYPG